MTLRFGLQSASDLYGKLQRDAAALNQEITSDNFFNFVVTGYSLIDWVRHETSTQSNRLGAVDQISKDEWLKICGDIVTAAKHHTITRRPGVITSNVTVDRGFGFGRFDQGSWGVGEEEILVELNDGRTFSCLEFVQGVLETWRTFFNQEIEDPDSHTE